MEASFLLRQLQKYCELESKEKKSQSSCIVDYFAVLLHDDLVYASLSMA